MVVLTVLAAVCAVRNATPGWCSCGVAVQSPNQPRRPASRGMGAAVGPEGCRGGQPFLDGPSRVAGRDRLALGASFMAGPGPVYRHDNPVSLCRAVHHFLGGGVACHSGPRSWSGSFRTACSTWARGPESGPFTRVVRSSACSRARSSCLASISRGFSRLSSPRFRSTASGLCVLTSRPRRGFTTTTSGRAL